MQVHEAVEPTSASEVECSSRRQGRIVCRDGSQAGRLGQGSEGLRKALVRFAPAVLQAAANGISQADVFLENLAALLEPELAALA